MTIKRQIKRLVENLTNTHIYRTIPRGIDVFQDITNHLPMYNVDTVFDVGANIGQSVEKFLNWYPKSQIYCIEPVEETFHQLQENYKANDNIHCFQLAFGSTKGKGQMVLQGPSDRFFLLNPEKEVFLNSGSNLEEVYIETLDEFCSDRKISHISYLKIDTEGGDLEVLKGAENKLSEHTIDLVQVEAGMNFRNEWHVAFEVLKEYLESKKYFIFGIYQQRNEWPTKEPHLRWTNPVFISERMIKANKE
ncbi:MAG: FkbM family methyltransferase [Bacteroidetes bacterium]|nr:FkbM family methyltransferase [Bacteroidota bacterium]